MEKLQITSDSQAGGIFGCLADIAKTAASAFERDDEDSGTTRRVAVPVLPATLEEFEKGMLERDDRRPEAQTAGCMMLLSTIAQAIVGAMGWNSYDDWRIKAEAELATQYLEELNLMLNQIGDLGMSSLSEALAKGALAQLEYLDLESNQIGDLGMSSLTEALAKGALANLKTLHLAGNPASDEAQQRAKDALKHSGVEVE